MKNADFKKLIEPALDASKKDGDKFFFVHISNEEDLSMGGNVNVDQFDILVIMKQMAERFKLDPLMLATALMGDNDDVTIIPITTDDEKPFQTNQ